MVSNQHRDDQRRADVAFVGEAVADLRHKIQYAVSSGWRARVTPDGEHQIVADAGQTWEQVLLQTQGDWAETVPAYLEAVQPQHMLSLLALLEDLARDLSQGHLGSSTRGHVIELCERLLGRTHPAVVGRRP